MKKTLLSLLIAGLAAVSFAQLESAVKTATDGKVTVTSRGSDVRAVIHDLFTQANKNYILDPNLRFTLYLNLTNVEFEEALMLICRTSQMEWTQEDGVYFVNKTVKKPTQTPPKSETESKPVSKPEPKPQTTPLDPKTVVPTAPVKPKPEPTGTLTADVLNKRVTTRSTKVDLRELAAELTKQTGVTVEIHKDVPKYKLDAFLINTSLKFGLDRITEAAKLRYRFTNRKSIEILTAETLEASANPNRVSLSVDPKN